MRSRTYSSEGVILARRNYQEADRILSLYTRDQGRITLLAKSIRRPKSRKRGHLEIFSHTRFQATSTKGIDLMTEAEVIDNFQNIRKNLKKVSLAYYFCEVVGKITHEGEPNVEVYSLLLENLERLKEEVELKKLRLAFVVRLLTILGYWPQGKTLLDPDKKLEEVVERQISSFRVGKILSA